MDASAQQAVESFLHSYMDANGRVVRRDQGGDTVSEGQAYAMLLSVAVGDTRTFEHAWGWARAHLQRSDWLLSWHWNYGTVQDPQSAGDADLITAWALVLASQRFHIAAYADSARAIARSLVTKETVAYGSDRLLVAGPWATTQPAWVNPSYFTPQAFATLRLDALENGATRALRTLTERAPHLPPDWARLSGATLRPSSSPDGQSPRFAYDAIRVPLWMSVSCNANDRAIAAAMWRSLKTSMARVYALDGTVLDPTMSAESLVAAAGAARAAGDVRAVGALLDKAQRLNMNQPRYYSAALVALARVLLTAHLLQTC